MKRILVIEDEPDIADLLAFNLKAEGFTPLVAREGEKGLKMALNEKPDLILLDLMLPGISGTDLCKQIKGNPGSNHIPIIMLTAKSEEIDRILGFELGADDYVLKPFSPRELLLRIKAVLKRSSGATPALKQWEKEGLLADFDAYTLTVDGEDAHLTPTEFNLFAEFVKNQGKVLSREKLLVNAWGYDYEGYSRTVDTHIRRLRKKLGPYSPLLETVRGIGYRLKA